MGKKGYISDAGLHMSAKEINYKEYVSEISKFPNRKYDLGPVASKMLIQFANHPYRSAYQIYSFLKKKGETYEMAYKNVHKRVKQLRSLDLIKEVEPNRHPLERSRHNPTYYRLTTGGIFHLIYKDKISLNSMSGTKKLFQNYSENIIFKTLLYPYFEKETLLRISILTVSTEILNYLNKCCAITDDTVELTKKDDGPIVMPLFNWDNPEEYDVGTMICLDYEFNLGFTERPRIKKIDSDEIIEISSKNKSVFIELNKRKVTAILTTADKKTYELGVEMSAGKYEVGMKVGTYKEGAFKKLVHSINYSLLTLATSIIMRITEKDFEGLIAVETANFKILSHDQKLMPLLERTKKIFEERYQTLIQLKNET